MSDLAVEHRAALDLIYPIADTLQIETLLQCDGQGARIRGAEKMTLPSMPKARKPFRSKSRSMRPRSARRKHGFSFRCVGFVGILGYLRQGRELQLCVVDGSKAHLGPIRGGCGAGCRFPRSRRNSSKGVVATYYRRKEESEWREIGWH